MAVLRFNAISVCGVHDLLHDMAGDRGRRQKGQEEGRVNQQHASSRLKSFDIDRGAPLVSRQDPGRSFELGRTNWNA
jgi:hypothetical protein